jgi:predicted AAA+ superfamily ATPase
MLVNRPRYLSKLFAFRDTNLIKVVTGVRRSGKSCLLELAAESLRKEGVGESQILSLNLESMNVTIADGRELYDYFHQRVSSSKRSYIFIDEVQRVPGWEQAINAMRVDFDCDIYVTGSNAFLFSSSLATYISGRYIEIKVQPLAFSEYLDFCGITVSNSELQKGIAYGKGGEALSLDALIDRYCQFGGMPQIANLELSQSEHEDYMQSLYDSVVIRDITDREHSISRRALGNLDLLRRLCVFLADNVGNSTSATNIANAITSAGERTTNKTISDYLQALVEAYLFHPVQRFDIRGKDTLRTNPKYYIVDAGIRSFLMGYRNADRGRVFENIVYQQLVYEGYSVHVGKLYQREVDFVAQKDGKPIYIQVAEEMFSEDTQSRELTPLLSIKDAHEKWVIVRQGNYPADINGVKIVPAAEFLLSDG